MFILRSIVRFFAEVFLLSGIGVLVYQGYIRYQTGEWFGMDLLWVVNRLLASPPGSGGSTSLVNWFLAPEDWIGLHRVLLVALDVLPLSLTLMVIGSFLFASVERGETERGRAIDAVEEEMRARQNDQE